MNRHDAWKAAIEAAAKVIHDKRHGTHLYSADEIANEALIAALHAALGSVAPLFDWRDEP